MPAAKKPKKTVDLVELSERAEQAMALLYLIQFRGKASYDELRRDLRDYLGVKMHANTIKKVCEALKKGQFITLGLEQTERGDSQTTAAIRTLLYKGTLEMAHIRNLLPRLLATEGAKQIKAWFENEEQAKNSKTRSGPEYRHIHNFTVKGILLDLIIGSQIKCQHTDVIRAKFPEQNIEQRFVIGKKKKRGKAANGDDEEIVIEVSGLFSRCPLTGSYQIPSDVLRGWWKANAMKYADMAEGSGDHVAFATTYIDPQYPMTQLVLPVQNRGQASAPKAHECIQAGEEITISFACPTTGYLHPAQIEKLVLLASLRPRRGLSPARGIRYGRFLVTSFIDHGPVNGLDPHHCGNPPLTQVPQDLSFLLSGLPPKLLDTHGDYLKEAIVRLAPVALGDARSKDPGEPAPFPITSEGEGESDGGADSEEGEGEAHGAS